MKRSKSYLGGIVHSINLLFVISVIAPYALLFTGIDWCLYCTRTTDYDIVASALGVGTVIFGILGIALNLFYIFRARTPQASASFAGASLMLEIAWLIYWFIN